MNMSMQDNNSNGDNSYKMAAIITVSVCVSFLTMTVIVSAGVCMFYCYCCQLGRVKRQDSESGQHESRISSFGSYGGESCEAIIPQGNNLIRLILGNYANLAHPAFFNALILIDFRPGGIIGRISTALKH